MRKFWAIFIAALVFSVSGADGSYAALVNGTEIPLQEFNTAVENARRTLSEDNSIDLESEEGRFILATTQRSILEDLINQIIIQQQAEKMRIVVTTTDVEEEIARLRAGFPSQKLFEETLSQENINTQDLTAGVRARLVSEKIKKELAGKLDISDKELDNFLKSNRDFFAEPEEESADTTDNIQEVSVSFSENTAQVSNEARKYLLRKKENDIFERWFARTKNSARIELNPDILQDEFELPAEDEPQAHPDKTITNGRV
ncbi:MAG: SurA N-terminal domain-containing protein [Candidatus Margulisbacteria bacterium]|jgi:hypothetical protein|nr:SurA N-terminal domain-containing protein [Candidatus Margulisiibacteriota bacterium]